MDRTEAREVQSFRSKNGFVGKQSKFNIYIFLFCYTPLKKKTHKRTIKMDLTNKCTKI